MIEYKELSPYELLEKLKITTVPIDPFIIAETMGVDVKKDIIIDKLTYDGEIYLNEKTHKPEIWINPTNSTNRQKFTMAHEIGHLVYDLLTDIDNFKPIHDNYKTLRRDGSQNPIERRANDYAAKLLMPKNLVLEIGQELIEKYNIQTKEEITIKLAEEFEVSQDAMKWRLVNLGLI